jgi:site-specific recombinase XerD
MSTVRSQKPMRFSKTDAPGFAARPGLSGRPRALPERLFRVPSAAAELEEPMPHPHPEADLARRYRLEPLVREWLLELQVRGCSQRTIAWYAHKMEWYGRYGQASTLAELTGFEFKRYLAQEQTRGISDNSLHGHFQVLKAFGNWACREGYPVDASFLRVRAPKVAQKEMESFTPQQIKAVLDETTEGWSRIAVGILLGTGMRVGELSALTLEDVEDDGDAAFLKIKRGKGAKFRRVPVSRQLRRELVRYVNRLRPECQSDRLLVLSDGTPVTVGCVSHLFGRLHHRLGFRVYAHKFRHTFATEYLRRGGEIERLRRILGHTTYVMVMRYVHLDKGDLYRDFESCAPF